MVLSASSTTGLLETNSFNFNGVMVMCLYGAAGPYTWNGTTFASLSVTLPGTGDWASLATSNIIHGHPFKGRVYYWSPDSDEFLYTALHATGGTVTEFPLDTLSQAGGGIQMITSLTMDGGSGPDDFLVIVLTTGETVVYQGSDPGSADDWSLVGRFHLPIPVNAGASAQMGADTIILTKRGLIPVQQFIKQGFGNTGVGWIDAINPRLDQLLNYGGPYQRGHRIAYCPDSGLLAVVVSGIDGGNLLYAMDLQSQSWARLELKSSAFGTGAEFLSTAFQQRCYQSCISHNGNLYVSNRFTGNVAFSPSCYIHRYAFSALSGETTSESFTCGFVTPLMPVETRAKGEHMTVNTTDPTTATNLRVGNRTYKVIADRTDNYSVVTLTSAYDRSDNTAVHPLSVSGHNIAFEFVMEVTTLDAADPVALFPRFNFARITLQEEASP